MAALGQQRAENFYGQQQWRRADGEWDAIGTWLQDLLTQDLVHASMTLQDDVDKWRADKLMGLDNDEDGGSSHNHKSQKVPGKCCMPQLEFIASTERALDLASRCQCPFGDLNKYAINCSRL